MSFAWNQTAFIMRRFIPLDKLSRVRTFTSMIKTTRQKQPATCKCPLSDINTTLAHVKINAISRCPVQALNHKPLTIITRTLATTKTATKVTEDNKTLPIDKLTQVKHSTRKKRPIKLESEKVVADDDLAAYVVGEKLPLEKLKSCILKEGIFEEVRLPEEFSDVFVIFSKYQVDQQAFFFSDGGIAFWHVPRKERDALVSLARQYAVMPFSIKDIEIESDEECVIYDIETKFENEKIYLKRPSVDNIHDIEEYAKKYVFSNALTRSVNLNMTGMKVDRLIKQLEPEVERLRQGSGLQMKKKKITMRLGEVFAIRHEMNQLLVTPDAYWDRRDLDMLFNDLRGYLDISQRLKVTNEHLDYCSEILTLINQATTDDHHVNLERIIIALICIEVFFECLHYAAKFWPALENGPRHIELESGQYSEHSHQPSSTTSSTAPTK